ncbi:hypothetical protein [Bacillus sp. RS11]|uniref:hypothetical protein n=1 Tax=Lysinibacillus sp. RS11 TaxID=3242682 RepID=UPI0035C6657F
MGISDRGTKAKSIMSCDNAFVTNIVLLLPLRLHYAFAQKTSCCCRYVCTTLSRKKHPAAAATLTLRFRAKNILLLPLR